MLAQLAATRRHTIILSIHQPRSDMFEVFDQVFYTLYKFFRVSNVCFLPLIWKDLDFPMLLFFVIVVYTKEFSVSLCLNPFVGRLWFSRVAKQPTVVLPALWLSTLRLLDTRVRLTPTLWMSTVRVCLAVRHAHWRSLHDVCDYCMHSHGWVCWHKQNIAANSYTAAVCNPQTDFVFV